MEHITGRILLYVPPSLFKTMEHITGRTSLYYSLIRPPELTVYEFAIRSKGSSLINRGQDGP